MSSGRASSSASASSGSGGRTSRATASRAPGDGRRLLLGATAMVALGSFLPWVATGFGNIVGVRGAGLWTFYVSMLGFTGAFLPWRRVAGVQALIMGAVSVALTSWQVVHLLSLVGTEGWRLGPGIVLVFSGGVAACAAGMRLLGITLRRPTGSATPEPGTQRS